MQEQNFEKQVKQKMEELSLTPSEPVWEKVEEQIRKKRDRRRFFFWLPLTVLLIGGGVWFLPGIKGNDNFIAVINKKQNDDTKENTSTVKNTSTVNDIQKTKASTKEEEEQTTITSKNFQENENIFEATKKELLPIVTKKKNKKEHVNNRRNQKNQTANTVNVSSKGLILNKKPKRLATTNNTADGIQKPGKQKINAEPGNKIINDESVSHDTIVNKHVEQNQPKNEDTIIKTASDLKANEKDSLSVQKDIAKNKNNFSKKWKFSIAAGLGRSGVNNGVGLFNGGAKSLEATNFFTPDRSSNFSQASSNVPAAASRPPSSQEKSTSFLIGILVKKQISKRSFLSTGLQYNFYSTQMEVGQNIMSDTVVDQNKNVSSFYANSGSNFSDYHNKFHFISLPFSFDVQLLNKIPLDFHVGLSLQQLVETNALLYSSISQVYYQDESAFNKTHLFSELGLEYSFPLSKKLLFSVGPRVSYSHSQVIKESSDRHLFSYGLVTEFIFLGK